MPARTPQRSDRRSAARWNPPGPRWAGDDAVPRALLAASAIMLRLLIVLGGLVLIAIAANRLLVVVLPLVIALMATTLLSPLARRLQRHLPPGLAAALAVVTALLVFAGLWALIIPQALAQGDELTASVQEGLVRVADALKPLGVDSSDLDHAVDEAVAALRHEAIPVAMLAAQWAGAIVLVLMLTFFFVKDGRQIWSWIVDLFHPDRRDGLRELGDRTWSALSSYVRGVFLVATIDAVFIGAALIVVGVPLALPLIVLTFIAAFFPILGATVAGTMAVLVTLVSNGVVAALVILAVILTVQQLEGNVFYPVVVGRRLRLHPVAILLALAVGGVLAGVAGAFIAVPLVSVASAVLDFARERRREGDRPAVLSP